MTIHPIIETMARANMLARHPNLLGHEPGCDVVDWTTESRDNPHVAQALAQAIASLRALAAAKPTAGMLDATFRNITDPDTASEETKAYCEERNAEDFRAMLLALLDEVDHA